MENTATDEKHGFHVFVIRLLIIVDFYVWRHGPGFSASSKPALPGHPHVSIFLNPWSLHILCSRPSHIHRCTSSLAWSATCTFYLPPPSLQITNHHFHAALSIITPRAFHSKIKVYNISSRTQTLPHRILPLSL